MIPANDDATKSIDVIVGACCAAIAEGLEERKAEKIDTEAAGEGDEPKERAPRRTRTKARADKSEPKDESDEAFADVEEADEA